MSAVTPPYKPDPFHGIPPEVLTTEQLADRLGFNTVTVRNWVRDKIIPGTQLGKEWRFWWPSVVIAIFYTGEEDNDPPSNAGPPGANGTSKDPNS